MAKMYDGGKIIAGLAFFIGLMTSPFWYNAAIGKVEYHEVDGRATSRPTLQKPKGKCVESAQYMRAMHMELLYNWREWFVRNNDKYYVSDGQRYKMSLTNTCLRQCHTNKAEFCDKCHNYVGVTPYCFDCHLIPKVN
jgi:hypothetical protein